MIVEKIKANNDYVRIEIGNQDYKMTFKIGLDYYLSLNYRIGQIITEDELSKLEKMHLLTYSYNKCLRKLESSDRSEKEIRDLLYPLKDLSEEDKDEIIERLKSAGFLSDEAVAETQFYVDSIKLIGKNKTIQTLKRRGVDNRIIQKFAENIDDKEQFNMALQKARRIVSKIKDKSFRETVNILKERLIKDGFENADEVVWALDLKQDELNEYRSVKIAYEKALRRYKNKYSDKKLYYTIYRYLLTKGFDSHLVNKILSLESEESDYED
ncbi:MAG TPA: RecX family transcriptional regulator [Erysipelotrichaceae bacterium]|nr:RecX family transcriptional regulator [Erysipelotrichaceae bacterium]